MFGNFGKNLVLRRKTGEKRNEFAAGSVVPRRGRESGGKLLKVNENISGRHFIIRTFDKSML